MKVLVVGGGGREHALVWKISKSPKVSKIYCAPGNGGMAQLAECVNIRPTDIESMTAFALQNNIDLVVVAPDDPLAMGMVDAMQAKGIRAFGPDAKAAQIEASKAFAKQLMKKYGIPTAKYEIFENFEYAVEHIKNHSYPLVVKADGLALGKGVSICFTFHEAYSALENIMKNKIFGEAGSKVVIEEFLEGQEVSILAFTDGKTVIPMISSQDHKRAFDNDKGPNTGGMGTFAPSPIYTEQIASYCMDRIFIPTMNAMNAEGRKFKGVLYFGLILAADGPKVLEYNARFGDPETQVVLPALKTDIIDIFNAVIDEKLDEINVEWDNICSVCVIIASGGYPGKYETGKAISGLDEVHAMKDVYVFHAGTRKEDNLFYTSGGRVLGVTACSRTLKEAIEKCYNACSIIRFENMHYRTDIGCKAIKPGL